MRIGIISDIHATLAALPQSLASMAIIPLQMKMVYRVGKGYGFELDRGHIKDLLATLGVGLTGQYAEQIGRKLIGGPLKTGGGGIEWQSRTVRTKWPRSTADEAAGCELSPRKLT